MAEQWRPIPGFDGWYEISRFAEVRSWRVGGGFSKPGVRAKEPKPVTAHMIKTKSGRHYLQVSLYSPDGKRHGYQVKLLMRDTWMEGPKPGMVVINKDGDPEVCSLRNLAYVPLGKGCGTRGESQRKPVVKYNSENQVVRYYKSISEAARKEYLTKAGMCSRIQRRSVVDGFYFKVER